MIWAGVFASVLVVGLSFAFYWGAYISLSAGHFGWLMLLFWGVFLFWQVFPIFIAGFGATFEFRTLLRFPLSLSCVLPRWRSRMAWPISPRSLRSAGCWRLQSAPASPILRLLPAIVADRRAFRDDEPHL